VSVTADAAFLFGGLMPIYSVMDRNTNEVFEVNMKFTEFEQYLKENSDNIKQVFTKFPATGDPVRLGKVKPDDGFRDVLRNVRHHHKKDSINTF
jgi:hypothetical protein